MRKARYRVWDKKCRIYLEIVGAEVGGKNTKFCGFKYIYCRPKDPSVKMKNPLPLYGGCVAFKLTDGVDSNRLVFEQDTGLKDKNGNSIWEGDIVEGTMGVFEVKWYDTASRFDFEPNMAMDWHPAFVRNQANEMEVVGNIHENPELLEEKKCD